MVLFNCNFVCCDTHTHNLYIDLYPVTLIIHHIKHYLEFLCIQIHFWVLRLGSRFLNHFFLWPDWTGRAFSTECWSEVGPCIYRVLLYLGGTTFNISSLSMMGFADTCIKAVSGLLGMALFPVYPILSADQAPLTNSSKASGFWVGLLFPTSPI